MSSQYLSLPATGGAVDSVNGQVGVVVLDADDVGAATQALDNLASVAINANILDNAPGAHNIGDPGGNYFNEMSALFHSSQEFDLYDTNMTGFSGWIVSDTNDANSSIGANAQFYIEADTSGLGNPIGVLVTSTANDAADGTLHTYLATGDFDNLTGASGNVYLYPGVATGGAERGTIIAPDLLIGKDATLSPGWAAGGIPGIVLDGYTADSVAAYGAGITLKGDVSVTALILSTQDNPVGEGTAEVYVISGKHDDTGETTGSVYLWSGTATDANSGNVKLSTGGAGTGNSGVVEITTGSSSVLTGDITLGIGGLTGSFGTGTGKIKLNGVTSLGYTQIHSIRTWGTGANPTITNEYYKHVFNNTNAGAENITLPAGEAGLSFVLAPAAINVMTYTIVASGGDTLDANIQTFFAAGTPVNVTFNGTNSKWYAT